ncbi:MAG TPA: zf-HC2 domain-containing protein [Acidobacteriota bacterium]|nr:zf-HC2 domain-containing protein [Acidobacteriota bacterium]HRV09178.1 zf-HC2 domain-containing protein [Acidobacteriota bacterium]
MKDFFKCQECVDLLTDYLEGSLDREVRARFEEHMSACAPCINFLKTFERSTQMLQLLREQQVEVPTDVQQRIKSFLRQEIIMLSAEKPSPRHNR